jgi:hypothetical protein
VGVTKVIEIGVDECEEEFVMVGNEEEKEEIVDDLTAEEKLMLEL